MNRVVRVSALIGVVAFAAASMAQTSDTYRIQPEDVLQIQVYRVPEIDAVLPVGPDGNISAPFIGTIHVAGKTIKEVESDLTTAYVDRLKLKDPIVSVTIREYRRIKASVGGFVGRPGVYEMRPGDRILDLLNAGGGTSTNGRADLSKTYLVKKNSRERIPIDLRALLNGDSSQNFIVEDGDNLMIPEQIENRVIVAGRVQRSGPIDYRENMTLTEVVQQAGEIPRKSRLSRIQVFRPLPGRPGDFLAIEADLIAFQSGKSAAQNIKMQPGDLVFVPDSGNVDFEIINSIANVIFIFDRFGINPLGIRN